MEKVEAERMSTIDRLFCLLFLMVTTVDYAVAQNTYKDQYNNFKQQAQADYENFRQKANKEYADWMRKAWEWHNKIEPMPRPKDEMLPPVIFEKEKQTSPKPMPYDDVVPSPEPSPQPKPIAPIRENEGEFRNIEFQFFGTDGKVRFPKDIIFKIKGHDENAFADTWEDLSSENYDNLIRDCLVLRMEHQLCDWTCFMMLKFLSEKVCDGVTYIASNAFSGCRVLTSLIIPNSVTSIRDETFSGCMSLRAIHSTVK